MTDDWGLGDPTSYSPDRFYVQVTKDAVSKGVKLRQSDARLVDIIISQKRFPAIETFSDFLRDAVHHRLMHLSQHYPDDLNSLRRERAILHMIEEEEHKQQTDEKIQKAVERIIDLRSKGHLNQADKLIQGIVAEVEGMDEDYWKTLWVDKLQAYFGMGIWGG